MRVIDLECFGRRRVVGAWWVDDVLVDPGPEACLETLLAALGDEIPRAILLTHIHFDHAGATGALVRRWPQVPVYVHERGAPHLAAPEKLLASAARVFGADGLKRRWGAMTPVPPANLRVVRGGERVVEDSFSVAYTPGHASHHVAYLHEASGHALVGDVAGIRIEPEALVVAPTPPPDVDLDIWPQSLATVRAWRPQSLRLSHFGTVTDVDAHLDGLQESMALQAERAAALDSEAFADWYRAHLAARMDTAAAAVYLEASPVEHMWRGLERWRQRAARRAAPTGSV